MKVIKPRRVRGGQGVWGTRETWEMHTKV